MKLLGLNILLKRIWDEPRAPRQWGILAKQKHELPQQTPANPKKKAQRKRVETSKRRNR